MKSEVSYQLSVIRYELVRWLVVSWLERMNTGHSKARNFLNLIPRPCFFLSVNWSTRYEVWKKQKISISTKQSLLLVLGSSYLRSVVWEEGTYMKWSRIYLYTQYSILNTNYSLLKNCQPVIFKNPFFYSINGKILSFMVKC